MSASDHRQVSKARASLAALRKLDRTRRVGYQTGRNDAATVRYRAALLAAGTAPELGGEARGALWSEHVLAERVSRARDAGQDRPELRARLAVDRRSVRALAAGE